MGLYDFEEEIFMRLLPFYPKVTLLCAFTLAISFPTYSLADQIDGDWCNGNGKHINIEGATIKTPGGKIMTGNYDRHGFDYVSPEGEDHAGKTLKMQQFSDDHVEMKLPDGSTERWRPCELTS